MNNNQTQLLKILATHEIPYALTKHQAVHSVEDINTCNAKTSGVQTKNILLWNKKTAQMVLVVSCARNKLDIKKISQLCDIASLSFVPQERLLIDFSVQSGSVSPLMLFSHQSKSMPAVCIDQNLLDSSTLAFHPGVNTATIDISSADLVKLFDIYKISFKPYMT